MMNLLRTSLLTNAVFSSLTSMALLLFTKQVTSFFSMAKGTVFLILGVGLMVFAITVAIEVNRQRPGKVRLIIFQDVLWVLASLFILIARPFSISTQGYVLIGVVAFLVFLFGLGQWLGLKRLNSPA